MRDAVTPLVGRDDDLAALGAALADSQSRAGRVFLVAGDPGTGKSRLVRDFVSRVRSDGITTLWGACSEFDLTLPFLPFNEAIGTHIAGTDATGLREQLGPLADAVAAIVPQLSREVPQAGDLSDAGARLRLFEGVVAVLRAVALAAQTGAVFVVEDVQWADASTRELLDFVVRRTRQLPLLLVMTYRCDEVGASHPLRVVLDGWRRAGLAASLKMRRLTAGEVRQLVCARLGADQVSRTFVDALVDRAEGLPFAVEDLLEDAIGSGRLFERDGAWRCAPLAKLDLPESLAAGIIARLDRLDPEHRRVVVAAAILGRRFDPRVLPGLTGQPAQAVSTALRAATAAHFLETDATDRKCLRFHHALTHEAVCAAVPVWEAAELHSEAADIISQTLPPAPVIERARHLLAAGRILDAAPLCASAAQTASRAGAFAEAALLYEQALAGDAGPAERSRLLFERGRMLVASGAPVAAIEPLQEGVALADESPDVAAATILVTLGGAQWLVGDRAASLQAYDRARALLENISPTADLALVYARLAMWHNSDLDSQAGLELADRALALADQLDAEQARAPALIYRGTALCQLGRRDEGLAVIDSGTAEAVRLLLPEDVGSGVIISAEQRAFAMRAGELPAIREFLRAADMGPATDIFASLIDALAGRFLGDVNQTEAAALAIVDGAESLGTGLLAFLGREFLAWARLKQGRLDDAEALMEDLSAREGMWHRTWGPTRVELATARGDREGAAAVARALIARVPAVQSDPFAVSIVVPALLAVHAEAEAAACVTAALGPDRHPMAVGAAADLAAYRGDAASAAELYGEAINGASAAGYRLLASHYQERWGNDADLSRSSQPAHPIEPSCKLSPREQELLALLASGRTDQQIASALFLSIRTVRSHLDRIRDKTGRRRRSELTRLALELGLLDA